MAHRHCYTSRYPQHETRDMDCVCVQIRRQKLMKILPADSPVDNTGDWHNQILSKSFYFQRIHQNSSTWDASVSASWCIIPTILLYYAILPHIRKTLCSSCMLPNLFTRTVVPSHEIFVWFLDSLDKQP